MMEILGGKGCSRYRKRQRLEALAFVLIQDNAK